MPLAVTLDHVTDVAANIKTFWFKPDQKVHYSAGQFTELYLPHTPMDDRGDKRWFTLSSSPTEDLLAITTKFASTTIGSSFKRTLATLRPGTKLQLAEPMGDFVLPKDDSIPLLFVAAGMGVTPMRSMTKWLTDNNEQRDITLIYAVHTPEDLAFKDLFTAYYSERFIPMATHVPAPPAWEGLDGELHTEFIIEYINDPATMMYLAGPEPLVEKLTAELIAKGIDKRLIITDYFPGYAEV